MEINAVKLGTAVAGGNVLPANVEASINQVLSASHIFSGANVRQELGDIIQNLSPNEKAALKDILSDSNNELTQRIQTNTKPEEFQELVSLCAPANNFAPITVSADTTHARAARGEDVNDDGMLSLDQWNFYRAAGNPPDVGEGTPISSGQTDAMLAAMGGDRSKPISVKEYLALLDKTKTADLHGAAARGEGNAVNDDTATFSIDQWNFFRSGGPNGLPVSGDQTDAMLALLGKDRDTPLTAMEYLALIRQTRQSDVSIEDKVFAAQRRVS